MANDLIHPITEAQIAQYEEDGVICIRGQFGPEWIDRMRVAGVGQIDEPSVRHTNMDDEGDPGRFISGAHMSRHSDEFMDFAVNSPAAEIAARLMRLDKVRFFYDQLFIKDPGTIAPTAWHNDLPFWPFDGNQVASVWIACTPVTRETSGLVYVAGSHKWGKLYKPEPAIPRDDFMLDEAKSYEDCPMFHKEFDNPDYRFLSWNMEPGDCLVHHPLTVHGSGKNASTTTQRVALSLRYFGGDATWHGQRTQFAVPGTEGDSDTTPQFPRGKLPADDTIFPVVWSGG
jgi:ectoine hydroxylase-related dioxygenase (phytanoyl-CoA dioxygenase family)